MIVIEADLNDIQTQYYAQSLHATKLTETLIIFNVSFTCSCLNEVPIGRQFVLMHQLFRNVLGEGSDLNMFNRLFFLVRLVYEE